LIGLDGISYGFFRDAAILHSNSIFLKGRSPFLGWYHPFLEDQKNVIFFDPLDENDLKEKILNVRENPERSQDLIRNSQDLAENVFYEDAVNQYIYKLLTRYNEKFLESTNQSEWTLRQSCASCCPNVYLRSY
jgi:hypothetical protein